MATFSGQLKTNEVIGALFNQIISIQTFADNIKGNVHGSFYEANKVDGSLYGDTKLYISTDIPEVRDWTADSEAGNLLKLYRPADPSTQAISLSNFKYVAVTIDNYMTKRAFNDEGSFSQFNSVVLGWLRDAKKVYMTKYFNVHAGIETSNAEVIVTPSSGQTLAQAVGLAVANLLVELQDASRDYNDLGVMRSYSDEDICIVWNAKYLNQITKLDLPVIFNNEGLVEKLGQYVLPEIYFGTKDSTKSDKSRSIAGETVNSIYKYPGEVVGATATGETYTPAEDVIAKITVRGALPIMGSFETTTNFFNEASLTETQRLIWGFNEVEHLAEKPYITLKYGA